MATRQTSIAFATAPPAPAFTANVGIESASSTTPVVVPFLRLDQYPLTITSSLALAARASPQTKPKQLHRVRVPRCSKSIGHSDNSILAHTSWHRLSFLDHGVKIARALLGILKCVLSRRHLVRRFSRTRECKLSHHNCDSCKFPTLVSNRGLLRQQFLRFASSKEFLLGPSRKTCLRC